MGVEKLIKSLVGPAKKKSSCKIKIDERDIPNFEQNNLKVCNKTEENINNYNDNEFTTIADKKNTLVFMTPKASKLKLFPLSYKDEINKQSIYDKPYKIRKISHQGINSTR